MKICIDGGHNYDKFDTGAVGNGLKEQDITIAIAIKLNSLLKSAGIETVMTRSKMTDNVGADFKSSINQRYKIANSQKVDYFVSIHCNAGGGTGTETLILERGGNAEKLANAVQRSVVEKMGTKDRGIKIRTDLGVLKHTTMPAILVETAFIDNAKDALLLKNNADDFAYAIAEGIFNHLGMNKTSELTEPTEIIEKLTEMVEINDKARAIAALSEAKEKNTSLYWILYKVVNK